MHIEWPKDNRPKSKRTITVNGKRYPAYVDPAGRLRFVANRCIDDLINEKLDFNALWGRARSGCYSKAEMHELYRLIGSSECGFSEIFEDDKVSYHDKK